MTVGRATTAITNQRPWRMADSRVLPPALTLADERTITPVMGSAPTQPQSMLPMPWAVSSLS